MDNGGPSGARSDHDTDVKINGVNGVHSADGTHTLSDKGKAIASTDGHAGTIVNGKEHGDTQPGASQRQASLGAETSRMNDLPDEIIHITQGFIPLSVLLTRLAQTTHNSLQEKIAELAKLSLPTAAANGNPNHTATAPDDNSNENLRKKAFLLNFIQDTHAKWVKALVILEWSRKSRMVSKLIDLKFHIDQQRILYDVALDSIANVKRDLTFARMPSPDLKTALQVLSTGSAPWMPDLQYIEPRPLTPDDQLKWMDNLNTLLSLRLNLEDYDGIPYQFRNYTISSGRVTFKVPGEFEVDLTIADEDLEKQFWFIDFRYAFSPSASSLPESLMAYLEGCVNDALGKNGLGGCYQFLHEFVLTSKINELRRQASHLSRSSWTGTLMVEPLNRALAIQYWTSRASSTGTKSWILVAVSTGRTKNGKANAKQTSGLVVQWYRDNKEIKESTIDFDVDNLSAEALLKNVTGKHIEFLLTSIHDKLLAAPRFKNREAGMILQICKSDPGASNLITQVGFNDRTMLLMEPTNGVFAVKPHSKFTIQYEHQLNNGKNPAEDGVTCLENIRCGITEDELNRRASSTGWHTRKAPINTEEVKSMTKLREWTRALWLQKQGWCPNWFVAVILGLGGDEWWLVETNYTQATSNHSLRFQTRLPLNKGYPDLSDSFWDNLALFATGMISQSVDMRELYRHRIKSRSNGSMNLSLPQQIRLPSIEMALSAVFPAMVLGVANTAASDLGSDGANASDSLEMLSAMTPNSTTPPTANQPWANNIVTIKFKGVQSLLNPTEGSEAAPSDHLLTCISDAIIRVKRPSKFAALKGMVDRDVSYDPGRGEFSLRMRHPIGTPMLASLKSRIKAIDRFVNFLESMDKVKETVTSGSVSLREVSFYYNERMQLDSTNSQDETSSPRKWHITLDLSNDEIGINTEKGNPHLRVFDLMRKLVNSEGGIEALMIWLPASLPALNAIDSMETSWEPIQGAGPGQLEFSMKTITWINLRYSIPRLDGDGQQIIKKVSLEVKVQARRGEAWWHISRSDLGAPDATDDEFTLALKPIWQGRGDGWLGLFTGAAGKPNGGVTRMLLAVDEAMRAAIESPGEATITTNASTLNANLQSQKSSGTGNAKPNNQGNANKGANKASDGKGRANAPVVVLD